ncbi:hypothetical protein [Deinococcus hopiensis]|uniref:hypothetical protein n=1 Tax=Deinococcus hopiensis TaxID=309885 RepID=UPI0009FD6053|nr:hypothetical protein [Deinococcus hopiensis]
MDHRDKRLNPIYEGTEAIQGNGLLRREVGAGWRYCSARIQGEFTAAQGLEGLGEIREALQKAVAQGSAALPSGALNLARTVILPMRTARWRRWATRWSGGRAAYGGYVRDLW